MDLLTWRGTRGFSIDGPIRIAAQDRVGLERLLRDCARPPFALRRLRLESTRVPLSSSSSDAPLIYALPRLTHDGRTRVRFRPLELLDRLARLVPPPRVHRHRYHGVFAPNARWRSEATRYGREDAEGIGSNPPDGVADATRPACSHASDRGPRRRWPQLLERVYEVQPPPIRPARGPLQTDLLAVDPPSPWDQGHQATHGRGPFDQSVPGDDGIWSA